MKSNDNLYNYLKDEEFQSEIEFEREPYKKRIKELNLLLNINGFSEIGDLFDISLYSVNKTLNVFKVLLEDRLKILESKAEQNKKISKSEEDYINILEKSELSELKIKELNKKIEALKNKIKLDEKQFKEEIEKIKTGKIEGEKTINRLTMKESQFKHEIRKYEKEIEEYKNKLKRIFDEKDSNSNKMANIYSNSNLNFNSKFNLKNSNNTIKTSSQWLHSNEQSQNIQIPLSLNTIIPDIESKNSSKILHNVEHLREFYNLVFNSMNEKTNLLISQNSDMKECYKLIYDELIQFLDFKKMLLYKLAQDSVKEIKILKENTIINYNIFELDFNLVRDTILQNFNDVLNAFRFILIFEILKVDPMSEFDFDDIKNKISNKKFDLAEIPYYAELKRKIEGYDFKGFYEFKEEIKKFDSINNSNNLYYRNLQIKKSSMIFKDDSLETENNEKNLTKTIDKKKNNLKLSEIDILEEMNQNIQNAMIIFEEKFSNLENHIEKANENILKPNSK